LFFTRRPSSAGGNCFLCLDTYCASLHKATPKQSVFFTLTGGRGSEEISFAKLFPLCNNHSISLFFHFYFLFFFAKYKDRNNFFRRICYSKKRSNTHSCVRCLFYAVRCSFQKIQEQCTEIYEKQEIRE